ncbi:MAG: hypothetical protein KJ915_05595 [Candidatus Omnitrophica bacterium]|nr:hypothetical protein [Candidatus Omnitrophota bacterium]
MKKGLILALILTFAFSGAAFAAESAQIAVTVTITQSVSVTVNPGSYAFGATDAGATLSTAPDTFTATNDGNGAENLVITVANTTNWIAGSTVGTDQFAMNVDTGSGWTLIDPATGSSLAAGVVAAGTQDFGLQLLVPSATTNAGAEQSIAVTVTASAQ